MVSVFSLGLQTGYWSMNVHSRPKPVVSGYERAITCWTNLLTEKLLRVNWLPFKTAVMFWNFFLLISSLKCVLGATQEALCISKACFTLHMNEMNFEEAQQNCVNNGGQLMTVRDREEEDVVRAVLSRVQWHRRTFDLWIGLKQHRGNCGLDTTALRGFRWVSGQQDSNYTNWKSVPVNTCTVERCVKIQYATSEENQLEWRSRSCKSRSFYMCKFYFKGMCKPLARSGPGEITYTAPFSLEPQRNDMMTFPVGTYADITCSDQQSYYSVCTSVEDIYKWTNPGPFCQTGEQSSCEIDNGGCAHLCEQDADTVRCACKEGFRLHEDGFSCSLENTCTVDSCEHQCAMGPSGFFCTCPEGFRLRADQRTCSDIDECQLQACHPHLCINTAGSYECACGIGYEMVDGMCKETDGCLLLRCDHGCSNSGGTFSCHCNPGFALSEDGRSCVGVHECVARPCRLKCHSTDGSFACGCPQGFHLADDGQTCSQDSPEMTSPSPGGQTEGDTRENVTESLISVAAELQHQSPQTEIPQHHLGNVTREDQQSNVSLVAGSTYMVHSRVLICVLGSVIPLMLLVAVTLAIAIFRCSRAIKEAKKATTSDGYCWVPSGLDPRLEKLYDSILTDDP